MLMRTKIESLLGRWNLVLTVTRSHKQPREEQKMIVTWTAHKVKMKNNVKSSDIAIEGSGVVLPGEIKRMHWKEIIDTQRSLESWSRLGHFIIRSISLGKDMFCDDLWQHRRQFLERTKDLWQRSRWLIIWHYWTNNWLSRTTVL